MLNLRLELEPAPRFLQSPAELARSVLGIVLTELIGRPLAAGEQPTLPPNTEVQARGDATECVVCVYEGWRSGLSVYVGRVPGTSRLSVVVEPASRFFICALKLDGVVFAALVVFLALATGEHIGGEGGFLMLGALAFTALLPLATLEWIVGRLLNATTPARLLRLRDALAERLRDPRQLT